MTYLLNSYIHRIRGAWPLGIAALTAIALTLCVEADTGKDAYKQGVRAEHKLAYDSAFAYYKQAHTLSPNNPQYFTAYTHMRFTASTDHLHKGQLLFNTGSLPEAMAEFERASEIDSTSFVAQQEMRRTAEMIRRQERQKSAPKEEVSPLARLATVSGESVELRPLSNAPITLHLTANADVAYKTVGKLAGLNVIVDPDYVPRKITVDLTDVTARQALDMIRLESRTFWHPVLANTIIVAVDSPAKRKDIEENVMKTFYFRNISTAADLQEAANVVRQILDVTRIQLLQAQGAMILRGTPDQLILAEKVLTDIDRPKSEVVIDVAVLQVSRDRIRTIGTNVPTSASVSLAPGGGAGGAPLTLKSLPKLGTADFGVSIPGASFSILSSDSNTKLLQNPEIRVLNDEKATLRIGDRVPIATGSFQPGGGGGVSPLVSTQFQYLDVGVNIDITPHIHSDHEVTLKMVLEISSVTGSENIGGITQPIIGQRRIEHVTRLADGDVNLLGGILEESETQSMSGYPWISKLPVLKYLFAQENKDRRENEIVFAITPHIIRGQEITEENLRTIEVGTGTSTELRKRTSGAAVSIPGRVSEPVRQPAPPVPPK